ncbi:MAG: peptidase S8/S53 domain-containing protein [Benjaminiella poitrasii]|nr:MAG: peptidase S8/S53 domain-containing protein [Benjaminiella poitrasii]
MMVKSTFIFFAVSCISAISAAVIDISALQSNTGNGNYIIQLNKATCIKDFVPKLIDNAYEIFTTQHNLTNIEKRGNRIVRRDTEVEQVHVFDAYDIGGSFKGIGVKFEDLKIVQNLLSSFNQDIVKIVPDMDVHIDLPTNKKKRFARRAAKKQLARAGNFDLDHYDHDENCPFHTKKATKNLATVAANSSEVFTAAATYVSQTSPQWNLARISQRTRDLTKPYIYDSTAGSTAYVYVVDDGMNTAHTDFGGRATWGYTAYSGISRNGGGHGTHVAGIVGGTTYGVAKKTNLIAVQVLDEEGSGTISAILSGLQWVTNNAASRKGKAVINMSLGLQTGGSLSSTLVTFNNAISAVVDAGVPIIAAAGNWYTDACDVLPAGNSDVYAVASSNSNDKLSSYSCWGTCVAIVAPGESIKSTYISSTTSTATLSGTSMASPHVAGVAALLLGSSTGTTPASLYSKLTSLATKNVVSSLVSGTPNLLLFNGQELNSA